MSCSSGCPTQDHASWGECVRAKNTAPLWVNPTHDLTAEKRQASRIREARAARAQGIMPDSTSLRDVRRAVDWSNQSGRPYKSTR